MKHLRYAHSESTPCGANPWPSRSVEVTGLVTCRNCIRFLISHRQYVTVWQVARVANADERRYVLAGEVKSSWDPFFGWDRALIVAAQTQQRVNAAHAEALAERA